MITCNECIERMKPDDPKVRSGRYHMCGCDYCDKPTYYRELEGNSIKETYTPEAEWSNKQWDAVNQYKGLVLKLQRDVNEHLDKKKKDTYIIK